MKKSELMDEIDRLSFRVLTLEKKLEAIRIALEPPKGVPTTSSVGLAGTGVIVPEPNTIYWESK